MAKTNLEIALEYADIMWGQHDLERGLTYITPELATPENVRHLTELFEALSDHSYEILEPGPIADGDYVVFRLAVMGTHDSGPLAGQPPSGKKLRWESIRILGFTDGKIDRTWAMQDRLGLMEQLGAVTSTADQVHWASGDDD